MWCEEGEVNGVKEWTSECRAYGRVSLEEGTCRWRRGGRCSICSCSGVLGGTGTNKTKTEKPPRTPLKETLHYKHNNPKPRQCAKGGDEISSGFSPWRVAQDSLQSDTQLSRLGGAMRLVLDRKGGVQSNFDWRIISQLRRVPLGDEVEPMNHMKSNILILKVKRKTWCTSHHHVAAANGSHAS